MQFQWSARDSNGRQHKGLWQGSHADACAEHLFARQLTPISISGDAGIAAKLNRWFVSNTQRRPDRKTLALFARQMHSLLRAGIPLLRAVNGLAESTSNAALKAALLDILHQLDNGETLGHAIRQHKALFGELMVSLVAAGETSGRLDTAFYDIAITLEREQKTRQKVWQALRYPLFVIFAIFAAMAIIVGFVVPAFADIFSGLSNELPLPTLLLLRGSEIVRDYGLLLLLIPALLWLFVSISRTHEQMAAFWAQQSLRTPGLGKVMRHNDVARICRTLALNLRSGVPMLQSLGISSTVARNVYLQNRLRMMRSGLERGASIHATATESGVFSKLALQMIAVGEESGALDELLDSIAEHHEQEAELSATGLSEVIQPILLLLLASLILLVGLGVFLPVWELSGVSNWN